MKQSRQNIHATCVHINGKGVLLLGKSGSGKSDLALRLIMDKGAVLVADDRAEVWGENNRLFAAAPQVLQSLLEVRGIGICRFEAMAQTEVNLAVQLVENRLEIERLPQAETIAIAGICLPFIKLFPFEASAPDKVILACK